MIRLGPDNPLAPLTYPFLQGTHGPRDDQMQGACLQLDALSALS